MLRRQAVSLLLGGAGAMAAEFLDPARGCYVLLDVATQRVVTNSQSLASRHLVPPGSTIKPLVLNALLRSGKLRTDASFPCPERLNIGGRRFDCSHPRLGTAVLPDTALAYSCNCFVAHSAERLAPGELARELVRLGLAGSGKIESAATPDAIRLQAIGEAGVLVTPLGMAHAYRQLARGAAPAVVKGMEEAVEFGTAQLAQVPGISLAGKTGSTRGSAGNFIAWFAGFTPSRDPKTVVVVMLSGRSGGADAAPVAAQILDAHRAGRL